MATKVSALTSRTPTSTSALYGVVGGLSGQFTTQALADAMAALFRTPGLFNLVSPTALAVGPHGNTNPTLNVDTSVSSAATGLDIVGLAAGSGITLAVISTATDDYINLTPKGAGWVNVSGAISMTGDVTMTQASSDALSRIVRFQKARGSVGSEAHVNTNDTLIDILGRGWDGTAYRDSASITAYAAEDFGGSARGSAIAFSTTGLGSTTLTTRLTITPAGGIVIASLPTSASGLASGQLWNSSGTVHVA